MSGLGGGRLAEGQGVQEGRSYDLRGCKQQGTIQDSHLDACTHAVHLPQPPLGVENNDGFLSRRGECREEFLMTEGN